MSSPDAVVAHRLRTALLLLAGAVALGALAELAMLRHWSDVQQLVPWVLAALVGLAAAALLGRRTPSWVVYAARAVGVIAALGSGYGVLIHILSNFEAGPLDFRYADRWEQLPMVQQIWLAATGGVGPAPALAPGMVALGGVCLLLGTLDRARDTSLGGAAAGRTAARSAGPRG